jgi:ribosomal protein S18 acetylase RimI-like enzyme
MLFATASLAHRIEQAECRLTVEAAGIAARRRPDVLVAKIGGGAAVFTGPGEPFNKMLAVGFGPGLDESALSDIEAAFDAREAPLQVELASLADGETAALLTRRGYRLRNFENVLGLELTPAVVAEAERRLVEAQRHGIQIAAAARDEAPLWMDAVVTGFAHPDAFDGPETHESFPRESLERVFADQKEAPAFRQYLARREGQVAGGGSMRLDSGIAQLCGAATRPEHRRQGVQSTLLRARLIDAARAGCDMAVVTTQPGSKSQENVQRAGFELLYARAILIREPGG